MKRFATVLLLTLGIASGQPKIGQAETAANAPKELTQAIAEMDRAANSKNLEGVIEYYDPSFTNTDGLTPDTLALALKQTWQKYPRLKYMTKIDSWSLQGDRLVAETTTNIVGSKKEAGRTVRLNSTIRSRQYFEQNKLVKQDILAEQSIINSGVNPPKVEIIAPEKVGTGEKYSFDLVVDEPLGDKVLLGAVKEEKTSSNLYLNPTALELEQLPAGGIYKSVTASLLPESNWLSAVLIRGDGITTIAHRVNTEEKATLQPKK